MISADVSESAQAYKSSRNSAAAFLLRYRFASVFSATFHHIFIHPEDLNLTICFLNFQIPLKLKIILEQSFHIDSVRNPQIS